MARGPRIVHPEFPLHVVLRGNNRRRLFSQAPDYHQFIYLLGRAKLRAPTEIHAVTLMTNHVHLIVTTDDGVSLARFVKHLAQRYAQTRNERRGASGRLFEERFFSRPILTDEQLAIALAYVELNPVRAGMVGRARDYAWSTHRCHLGDSTSKFPRGLWTPSAWYLRLAPSIRERTEAYSTWVEDCRSRDVHPDEVNATVSVAEAPVPHRPDGNRAT